MTQNNEREAFERLFPKPKVFSTFNEQQKLMGQWLDCKRGWETAIAYVNKQNEQQPKQIPDGWKLIGKVSEMGVVWHKQNPHAHPVGTEFYAVTPTNTEVGE